MAQSLFNIQWREIFVPETPLLETFLRGTIMYLGLFALLRFLLKREAGSLGITDLLVVVLISDAAQNAMAADYHSITDGIILVAVIVGWSYVLDWLGYKFPPIRPLIKPPPLLLVKNGRLLRRNMRRELITEDELLSHIREAGVGDLQKVKRAYMESDGRISVVTEEPSGTPDKAIP